MKKVRKAIIPVAGMGTRFLPITKAVAKEMLPLIDKPTIHYIVEEAINSGIEQILFVTNSYKKIIEDYFDHTYELEARLEKNNKQNQLDLIKDIPSMGEFFYIRQGEPLGTGHAIKICKNFIGDEPFAVMYGDDIVDSDIPTLKKMIDIHYEKNCNVLCALELSDDVISSKGIIGYENKETGKINNLIEKPSLENAPSNHGTLGRYILKPEIFDELDHLTLVNGEYLLTDAMLSLMKKDDFYSYKLEGTYYDIGTPFGYLQANIEYGLKRDDIKENLKDYLKNINI